MSQPGPILVVEDNVDLAENMAELLSELRTDVKVLHDAPSAIEYAKKSSFDLALLDLRLGDDCLGIDLLPRLKESSPDGEIILVTGNATVDTAVRAVRHGVFAYVLKPFDPEDLLTISDRALSQVSLRRERKRLMTELATSEALHRGLVHTVPAMIVTLDPQGRIAFANPCATIVTGYSAEELVGRSFVETCAVAEDAAALGRAVTTARQRRHVGRVQCTLVSKEGSERVVRWYFTLSRVEGDGGIFIGVGLDVTGQLELERKAASAEARAVLGTLTAGLAHEIRNPLNAAKLQLELIGRTAAKVPHRQLQAQLLDRSKIVQSELERLSTMLEEFLSLARPRGLDRRTFPLDELIAEVVELHRPLLEASGVTLEVACSCVPCEVAADRAKIKQALINLVRNAFDATAQVGGGSVRIAVVKTDAAITVEVRDSGRGLSAEVAEQIFEPFVTTKEAGTGLGLTVVRDIVERHGGTVTLSSQASGGAVARFVLPSAS